MLHAVKLGIFIYVSCQNVNTLFAVGIQARGHFGGLSDSNVTRLLSGSKRALRLRAGRLLHRKVLALYLYHNVIYYVSAKAINGNCEEMGAKAKAGGFSPNQCYRRYRIGAVCF